MIEFILEPFNYHYMVKAIFTSMLVGSLSAFLSVFLMLKGWSLMGDAISHAIIPGVAIAYIFAIPYAIGAFISAILATIGINFLYQNTKLKYDTAIGILLASFFAFGLLIISVKQVSINVRQIVLGDILGISNFNLSQVVILSFIALILIILKYKDLILIFFDENYAKSIGVNSKTINIIFFIILTLIITASLQTVGVILVMAMLITPGATAFLIAKQFKQIAIIASSIGFLSSSFGVYLSYFLDVAPTPMVVILQSMIFTIVFLFYFIKNKYDQYC